MLADTPEIHSHAKTFVAKVICTAGNAGQVWFTWARSRLGNPCGENARIVHRSSIKDGCTRQHTCSHYQMRTVASKRESGNTLCQGAWILCQDRSCLNKQATSLTDLLRACWLILVDSVFHPFLILDSDTRGSDFVFEMIFFFFRILRSCKHHIINQIFKEIWVT